MLCRRFPRAPTPGGGLRKLHPRPAASGRLDPGPAPGHPGPRRLAARGRTARQHRDADHGQHGGRHRRRRRARAWRPRRRGSRPDRRAHQRRHTPGPSRRSGAHPAVLHLLPAPGMGLDNPGLDAPPRIHLSRLPHQPHRILRTSGTRQPTNWHPTASANGWRGGTTDATASVAAS